MPLSCQSLWKAWAGTGGPSKHPCPEDPAWHTTALLTVAVGLYSQPHCSPDHPLCTPVDVKARNARSQSCSPSCLLLSWLGISGRLEGPTLPTSMPVAGAAGPNRQLCEGTALHSCHSIQTVTQPQQEGTHGPSRGHPWDTGLG